MMCWLIRFEAFPQHFTHSLQGYQDLISDDILVRDSWMVIKNNDTPVGYSYTTLDINEASIFQRYEMANNIRINLNIAKVESLLKVDSSIHLDITKHLEDLSLSMSIGNIALSVTAKRHKKNTFMIDLKMNDSNNRRIVEIPEDTIFLTPFADTFMKDMKPGQSIFIKSIDPLSMKSSTVTVKAIRMDKIQINGKEKQALLTVTPFYGINFKSWIAHDGTILKQETPFGWTMESAPQKSALKATKEPGAKISNIPGGVSITELIKKSVNSLSKPQGTEQ